MKPHSPCTAPPGGVEDEQRERPDALVEYGFGLIMGLAKSCLTFMKPPFMSPPTRLAFQRSRSAGPQALRARTRSPKPGAKRSICASILPVMSKVEPLGT